MKKFILFLIAIFCISSFTSIIEAKPNTYAQYQKQIKRNAKRSTRKFKKHHRTNKNYGQFKSKLTGKPLCGVQSLSYINSRKKKCY